MVRALARQEKIAGRSLMDAVARAEAGLIDANLGGGVIKQRLARKGQGRSGGYRALIAFRVSARAVFLYAFAKNERANIDADELVTLKQIAETWLAATETKIDRAIADGALIEVKYET
jgi:hypothetical protein